MTVLSDRLRLAMERREISEVSLAKLAGVNQTTLNNYLTGVRVRGSAPIIGRLANALGCSAIWLASGEGSPSWGDDAVRVNLLKIYDSLDPRFQEALLEDASRLSRLQSSAGGDK